VKPVQRSIFYSWQSDLETATNRSFIEEALRRALKAIKKDESDSIEPALDRDTVGLSGSPSITDSIFEKISLADAFVADVSIINKGLGQRPTPNPNILTELGYAVAQLGWGRVLLVQNTAHGGPEDLPFDLRGRRITTYELQPGSGHRAEARGLLQGRLEAAIKGVLHQSNYVSLPAGVDVPLWWGNWSIEAAGQARGGSLFIREVGSDGFLFDLSVFNGSHLGNLTGYARLVSKDAAYARVENGPSGEVGEISFKRSIDGHRRTISLRETASCSYYRGMGAYFGGEFTRRSDGLFDGGFLNELELARLYTISGEYFEALSLRFQGLSTGENIDSFHAAVVIGGVRGLYTIMEGIIMRGMHGELWVSYIDDGCVRYFTTQTKWKNTLPKTIDAWRERFKEKPISFHPSVDVIKSDDRLAHE
jgi:hypothetical protein